MTTTTALSIFRFKEHPVRIVEINGEPWWVANEIGSIIGLSDTRKSVNSLNEDERKIIPVIDSMGRAQPTLIINEPGLYRLLMRSHKPAAEPFQRWVTHEVLPQIRKTGQYSEPGMLMSSLAKITDAIGVMTECMTRFERRLSSVEQQSTKEAKVRLQTRDRVRRFRDRQASLAQLRLPVPETPMRGLINQLVRSFVSRSCRLLGERFSPTIEDCWNDLYREFYYRYHIDLKAKARNSAGLSPLDIAEDGGIINELFTLAAHMYAGK